MTPLERVLAKLDGVTQTSSGWNARCPAHEDDQASLTLAEGDGGRALLHCHAGCAVAAIVGALGLTMRDLMPPRDRGAARRTVYRICDPDGTLIAEHVREDWPGNKRMWWRVPGCARGLRGRRTETLPLYRTETLPVLAADALVVIVEGEKCADALGTRGIVAVATVTGAAGTPSDDVLRLLVGHDVVLWPDADRPGREHMQRIAGRLVALDATPRWYDAAPEAADGRDAADDARDTETLRAEVAGASPWAPPAAAANDVPPAPPSPPPARSARESAADALVRLALERLELWQDPDGEPYASLATGDHTEHHALRARAVRSYLAREYYTRTQRSARTDAVTEALATLEGLARYEGEEHSVAVRVGQGDGTLYLDLADAGWRAVEVTPAGWRVVDRPPVRFRRPRGLRTLSVPVAGGSVDDLRTVLPVVCDDDWHLIVAWLLAALRPMGPYPVLCLHGEAGAAKSTTARILRSLVDPALAPLRAAPRDERDLVIAANNGHVVALDNLSHVPSWLSDGLCRLSTGGGYATRALYTDTDETLLDVQRPVMLTGIEELAVRGDLADRALVVTLPAIADDQRVSEATLAARLDVVRPRILGALLNAVATGLRELPHTRLDRLPRLADAALWWAACEFALPWRAGTMLAAHERGRSEAAATTLEASVVGAALLTLLAARGQYDGTAGELLDLLGKYTAEATIRDRNRWPQSARGLAGALRRLAPALRRAGWSVEWPQRRGSGRPVTVRRATVNTVTTVTSPADASLGGDGRGDDAARPSLQPSPEKFNDAAADDAGDGRDGHAATSRELRI